MASVQENTVQVASGVVVPERIISKVNLERRLISTAPQQIQGYSFKSFYASKWAKAYHDKRKQNIGRIEPLPCLANYQTNRRLSFIREQNRHTFMKQAWIKPQTPTTSKPDHFPLTPTKDQPSAENLMPTPPKQPKAEGSPSLLKKGRASRNLSFAKIPLKEYSSPQIIASDIHDIADLIEIVKTKILIFSEKVGFLYMIPRVNLESTEYSWYNVRIVSFDDIDRNNYATISKNGVTRTYNGDIEFTPLQEYERDYKVYCQLKQKKTFNLFRQKRAFHLWRKNIRRSFMKKYAKRLQENLFSLNGMLSPCLLYVGRLCYEISLTSLFHAEKNLTYQLKDFKELQHNWFDEVEIILANFRNQVKEAVTNALNSVLLFAGFIPDGYMYDPDITILSPYGNLSMTPTSAFLFQTPGEILTDPPEKMTFVQQSRKKNMCRVLTHFIRLVDYMICAALHRMMVDSMVGMFDSFSERYVLIPSEEKIRLWRKHNSSAALKSPERTLSIATASTDGHSSPPDTISVSVADTIEQPVPPLFITELILELENITLSPSLEIFLFCVEDLICGFRDTVLTVENLLIDSDLKPYTRPIINSRQEPRIGGNGPDLGDVLAGDTYLTAITNEIQKVIEETFAVADVYVKTLTDFNEIYSENENLDVTTLKIPEDDVKFFSSSLQRYNAEKIAINEVKEERNMGLIMVDAKAFKNRFLPSHQRCVDAICKILPDLARKRVNDVITEVQDARFKLEYEPETTKEFVICLTFLDTFVERSDSIDEVCHNIADLYGLIDEYKVATSPEDAVVYKSLNSSVANVRAALDKALSQREVIINRLQHCLNDEIEDVRFNIKALKQQSQDSYVLGLQSDRSKVAKMIEKMLQDINLLGTKATQYQGYQKQFGLTVARFDDLDEVRGELKLKHLLWSSLSEWDGLSEEWHEKSLHSLNPDSMNAEVLKYLKHSNNLERGLPPNEVVPVLKNKVMNMKGKMPVVVHLLNPTFKMRHWEKIEQIIGHHLPLSSGGATADDDSVKLNLQHLTDWGVFENADAIAEVSAEASGESSMEAMLKTVEDTWKKAELNVLQYREVKDVYVLGGIEDVQMQLEDSRVTMATIASSRYVGPIKEKVIEWQKNLDVMHETLEEWATCQRNWIYLEAIFSAPDIQRQLPTESKMFSKVHKSWKEIMRNACKFPNAVRACTQPGLIEQFQTNNTLLEQIQKCLEAYLESKRMVFPRFYFLSNDELIEILAQCKNPQAVQPHLRKCFDAIAQLEFGKVFLGADGKIAKEGEKGKAQKTNDINAMISPEGETVGLGKGLKARGHVEDWLGKVEEAMIVNLRKLARLALADFFSPTREEWSVSYPSQIVLSVSQIIWCQEVTKILKDLSNPSEAETEEPLKEYEELLFSRLNNLAALVRTDLPCLHRNIITALITIDVHARDVVSDMVRSGVQSPSSFQWLRQLRYYWSKDEDDCVVRCAGSQYVYGYEYLGACARLVITPLTDRCYLCLMGALQLNLGGAPAGPAGTGKTETTKDLAKTLAKQCVVFNCSEGLDYKMMGRFFSGLAQSGAWCCFDEFNRIDIEVLSVIAQQLLTIRNAKMQGLSRFLFEGREIKLEQTCAAFITMNPGYAGRTELPDNLKALFRPIAMMVPDYKLIAEVILYSEGFESSKTLSQKMVQLYKLCSEQLSQQDHYDFGMRAVKSVLVMAGSLKRENPDIREDIVLIRALRDSNLPKFLYEDAELFRAILSDLFPGVSIPEHDYGILQTTVKKCLEEKHLQPIPSMVKKIIQLYETLVVRHGVMLVGPTGGGKTTVYQNLAKTMTVLSQKKKKKSKFKPVRTTVLNPKSISMGELYGEVNRSTLEWKDGLIGMSVRHAVQDKDVSDKWIICDGPVDALWVENMNTLLDDNKMLCLANSERIKLTDNIRMLFEVEDLAAASPATVSRCGMVYVDPHELGWKPYVQTWVATKLSEFGEETRMFLRDLFDCYIDGGFKFISNYTPVMKQVKLSKVVTLCALFESLMFGIGGPDLHQNLSYLHSLVASTFVFSYIWSLAGNFNEEGMERFDSFMRSQVEDIPEVRLPLQSDLFNYYLDFRLKRFEPWEKVLPTFVYDNEMPYFDILVPTIDTVRYSYLMRKLVAVGRPFLYTGGRMIAGLGRGLNYCWSWSRTKGLGRQPVLGLEKLLSGLGLKAGGLDCNIGETGVGKSVVARALLEDLSKTNSYLPVYMNFSAHTSSNRIQDLIEAKLERKRKNCIGAPLHKHVILFADDLNLPKLDRFGSQPTIELLRQLVDFGGLYDREKLFWKEIFGVTLTAACAPPGGGRNPVSPRFIRHFALFSLPTPNEFSLRTIFSAILCGFLADFPFTIKEAGMWLVDGAIEIYRRMSTDFLPTPAKSHYVFNLRDLSKCVQGLLKADIKVIRTKSDLSRLFYHEALRVFHDRLINLDDKLCFYEILAEVSTLCLRMKIGADYFTENPIVFGDFLAGATVGEYKIYQDYSYKIDKIRSALLEFLDQYNLAYSKEMSLVFFVDAIEHICRIIRIIATPRGNALLVGVGGCGKQCLTRLASYVCGYKCFQIELNRQYNHNVFREDLKQLYELTGVKGHDTVFLFTDTQIVQEEFLEDVNSILNSGEVPNLYERDEYERVLGEVRSLAADQGIAETDRDAVTQFFISRVRSNLHVVLCMSPMGESFRSRCRMFPSIVNCCTIDWFIPWPKDALLSVSRTFLDKDSELKDDEREALANICVEIHMSVNEMSDKFYKELRRYYYTTPTSYLELINLYLNMLHTKRRELIVERDKFETGLNKLLETYGVVDTMKGELAALEPLLIKKNKETEELMRNLAEDQQKADEVRKVVIEDEAVASVKAEETQLIADDAQKDLNLALPFLRSAQKALNALDKSDIAEIKVFANPPDMVMTVMETVCILLNTKVDWPSAKALLGDANFLRRLINYDKDNVPQKTIKKLDKYIDNPDFLPENVEKVSKACKSICMWVRAMHRYANVLRVVEPKRLRYEGAKSDLDATMSALREKQDKLKEVEEHIAQLQESYDSSVSAKERLMDAMRLTTARMRRAKKLTAALGDEQIRWKEKVTEYEERLTNLVGDVLVGAACIAYYGAFTSTYREKLVQRWTESCKDEGLPTSHNISLVRIFGDAYEIRQWNTEGLPRDIVSTENAILVTQSWRWPLMIDPQDQANRWVRNMELDSGLKVTKMTNSNFLRTLETCMRVGLPVLCEELGESLDPAVEPVLLKQTFTSGGRLLIRLGDSDVDYDKNFRFYMTTKLPNPHYLPEVCIKVTVINFTVTRPGLEDQILSDVVRLERPDLEKQRTELILRINSDKAQLKEIEDQILKLLFKTKGNILDNEVLINTLDNSKVTSDVIAQRLEEAEDTETNMSYAREKYRPVATRGSVMFFVVSSLTEIDPMYQFSLQYFNSIFNMTISNSKRSTNLEKRLKILMEETTYAVYRNVSRGLFERHKLIFSFLLSIGILQQEGHGMDVEWNYFLRGASGVEKTYPDKPSNADWLTKEHWIKAVDIESHLTCFHGLSKDLTRTPIYCALGELEIRLNPESRQDYLRPEEIEKMNRENKLEKIGHWEERLTLFEKLLLVKYFMREKLVSAVTDFVSAKFGKQFVESPPVVLSSIYADMTNRTPLVFVLSTGSDPMGAFLRFAKERKWEKVEAISLGQGQGPIAEKLLVHARQTGGWVFLQNCHLAKSFMPRLKEMVQDLKEMPASKVHDDFRLFLSSMPADFFPVAILQGSVKVTNEPPKGLRSNIRGAFATISKSFFEDHSLGVKWRKMVFGICFFHAVVQERKKFGALGWNIGYEFNDSDRECALLNLELFCKNDVIPWDALVYITGEITYGGRVRDSIDQRCLRITLLRFFDEKTLEDKYKYSESGVYFAPSEDSIDAYVDYVNRLPTYDDPEIFGMHNNANLFYQKQETKVMMRTILDVQPRVAYGGAGGVKSSDEVVDDLASSILEKIEKYEFDWKQANHVIFKKDERGRVNSLTTVLQQEVQRYVKLRKVLMSSLKNLKKTIGGFVVMSEEMEKMYTSFLNNRVPEIWENASYPSLKPLGSWVKDFQARCNFMTTWIEKGLPYSFWISGFFFPQGFLTGALQNHARKYNYPIDRLSFQFHPLPVFRNQTEYQEEVRTLKFGEKSRSDKELPKISDGVMIHGLYTDAFRFDVTSMKMVSEEDRIMHEKMPLVHMEPVMDFTPPEEDYQCPVYKTAARAGVLSTTGHSTNFVIFIHLPSDKSPDFWVSRGSAMLCGLGE